MDYVIKSGDSKELLLPQLNDIGRMQPQHRPMFVITICRPEDAHNTGAGWQNQLGLRVYGLVSSGGLGNSWRVYAYSTEGFDGREGPIHVMLDYDTNKRSGKVTITDGPEPFRPA